MITIDTLKGFPKAPIKPPPPPMHMDPPSITSISYTEPGATYRRPIIRGKVAVSDSNVTVEISAGWPRTFTANVNGNDWWFQKDIDMNPGQFDIVIYAHKSGYFSSKSSKRPFYILESATGLPTIQLILQKKLVSIPRPPKPNGPPKPPKDTKNDRLWSQYESARRNYYEKLKIYERSKDQQYEQMSIGWFTTNAYLVRVSSNEYSPFGINVIQSGSHGTAGSEVSYNLNIEAVGPLGTTSVPCTFTLKTIL